MPAGRRLALACLDLLLGMGLKHENVVVTDVAGVVHAGREELMDRWKVRYAVETDARTLAEVIGGADVFLGLSAPGVLEPEHVRRMAESPLILALANPVPEILPEVAREARRDAIVATGRSDYPNQVNNVLCFPFIFRGALSEPLRSRLLPGSRLKGQANLLVMPNVEAANIAHNLLRALGGGVSIGPIVIGAARSAHVVT